MLGYLARFQNRLSLPNHMRVKVINLTDNRGSEVLRRSFNANIQGKHIIELYHSSRFGLTATNMIAKDGFRMGDGNKGPGVYLSNHSRYSIWAGRPLHTVVCDVITDEPFVHRFKSELRSPRPWNSDFLVTKPELIFPKYIIYFDLVMEDFDKVLWKEFSFVGKDDWHCNNKECRIRRRCDCPQHPLVLLDDVSSDLNQSDNAIHPTPIN